MPSRFAFSFVLVASALVLAGGHPPRPAAAQADPVAPPKVVAHLDLGNTDYSPDQVAKLTATATELASVAAANYPMIVRLLGAEHNYHCPEFTIVIKKMDGVAGTANDKCEVSAQWMLDHPDDVGLIVHELAHVVQHYGPQKSGETPGWLTEGIADYVRWFNFEPAGRRPHPGASRASATGSYQTTASFLDWAVRKFDVKLVKQLNQAMYDGNYSPAVWRQFTGKSLGELDTEWVASLSG